MLRETFLCAGLQVDLVKHALTCTCWYMAGDLPACSMRPARALCTREGGVTFAHLEGLPGPGCLGAASQEPCIHMQGARMTCWQRARAPAQEALGVGEGEVEVWVVRAIGRKLLAARIDQMRRTVAVTKCAQRTFSAAQWRALLAQLGAWKARPRRPAAPAPGLRWSLRRCRLHMLLAPLCSWLMQLVFISAARSS